MGNSEISRLRQLLLNLDEAELEKLKKLLNYPNDLALEISKVLPEAVLFSIHDSERLSTALVPMIESVIARSVAQNPRLLADALYPVIGRSIRKSINEEFKKLLQTFNELIENTFSYRSLKWRYQALVTGRKYSEVVISNTIKYKAEHVFLIHRETGLLLCEVHDEMSQSADPDAISGMLKAITDFVHDSFQDTGASDLNLIEMEEYQVLIEQGPHAIIASLVKGFALDEYREILRKTLENIHDEYAASLLAFNGDTYIFETSRELLGRCLRTEKKEEFIGKKSRIGIYIAIPVLAFLLFMAGRSIYFNWQWEKYISRLKQSELVLLSQHGKSHRSYFVKGLLLPGAVHPDSLIANYHFPQKRFESNWHLYLEGDHKMIVNFIHSHFNVPTGVHFDVGENLIKVGGVSSEEWLGDFRKFVRNNLSWYTVKPDNLRVLTMGMLQEKISRINNTHLYFGLGSVELAEDSNAILIKLEQSLRDVIDDAQLLEQEVTVHINGYADQYGDINYNKILSANRAAFVKSQFVAMGIPDTLINIEGLGIMEGTEELSANERRRVNFQITLKQASND